MNGMRTRRISSVAYADDERLSDAKTARAVGLPSRSCSSASVWSGGPRSLHLSRYPSESAGTATPGTGAYAGPCGDAAGAPRPVSSVVDGAVIVTRRYLAHRVVRG